MKVAVVGSRTVIGFPLESILPKGVTLIISGGAKGVDTLAAVYAKAHGIPVAEFLPDYKRYGKAAPLVRNRKMVDACDRLVAVWDGVSKGTAFTIAYAEKQRKPVTVCRTGPERPRGKQPPGRYKGGLNMQKKDLSDQTIRIVDKLGRIYLPKDFLAAHSPQGKPMEFRVLLKEDSMILAPNLPQCSICRTWKEVTPFREGYLCKDCRAALGAAEKPERKKRRSRKKPAAK